METKKLLSEIKGFVPDISYIEEDRDDYDFSMESDKNEELITLDEKENTINTLKATPDTEEKFSAFIDGTYITAKIGYLYGVPIYVSNITCALLIRDDDNYSKNFNEFHKNLFVLMYPFDSVSLYAKEYKNDKEMADAIRELKDRFCREYNAIMDFKVREDSLNELKKINNTNIWICSDISYKGLQGDDESGYRGDWDIEKNEIFNMGKISRKVRARTRVIMGILEATYLRAYREKYGNDKWVLMDGTLNYSYKYCLSEYRQGKKFNEYFDKTVGFVKTIRRKVFESEPEKLFKLFSMKEGEYIITMGIKNDTEEKVLEELNEREIGKKKWGFVYMRFRFPPYLQNEKLSKSICTPKGIIKAQFVINETDEDYIKEYTLEKGMKIANMIAYEKFPLPSDKKRLWNETLAIEEAEKVAKSRLMSKHYLEHLGLIL